MKPSGKQTYHCEGIEINLSQGYLKKDGQDIYLRQKLLQVLSYLLAQRDRVVTKEELIREVWDGNAITDEALSQSIKDLRKALGDDSRQPRFIKTIPKIGYRFIGPISELPLEAITTISIQETTVIEVEELSDQVSSGDHKIEAQSCLPIAAAIIEHQLNHQLNHQLDHQLDHQTAQAIAVPVTIPESLPAAPVEPAAESSLPSLPSTALAPVSPLPPLPPLRSPRRYLVMSAVIVLVIGIAALSLVLISGNHQSSLPVTLSPQPGKRSLAVMYFENQSGHGELDWLREGLADMLITELSRSARLTVLGRQQLSLLLERIKPKSSTVLMLDEALAIGRRIKAEVVVMGSYSKIGDRLRISISLYNTQSGQLVAAESVVAETDAAIIAQTEMLSFKLAAHLGASVPAQTNSALLHNVVTDNLDAYRYYSLAMEQVQMYQLPDAVALLEKAITHDPQFAMAYGRIGYIYGAIWKQPAKAKPYLEKAFQLSGRLNEKERLYISAWYASANNDVDLAIETYRKLLKLDHLDVE